MQTGKNGVLEFTPNVTWAAVRLHYTEQWDVAANRSLVTVTGVEVKSTNHTGTYYIDGRLEIDGQGALTLNSAAGTAHVAVKQKGLWYPLQYSDGTAVTASAYVTHDNDGAKTVDITLTGNRFLRFAFYTADGADGNGWGVKQSLSLALTDIPRAAAIAATDANIGAVSTVTVTRHSVDHAYSIGFAFGTLTGWLDADGSILAYEKKLTAAIVPFLLPESFYEQIPDAPAGQCRLTCSTYLGDQQVGQTQETTFTATAAPGFCGPVVTGWVEEGNPAALALTGDNQKLIRHVSHARCAIAAQGQKGATIVSRTIDGQETQQERILENIDSSSVVFSATDSRGYTASHLVSLNLIDYIPLTLRVSAKRLDPTGDQVQLQVRGNYFDGDFGAVKNSLRLAYQIGQRTGELEATIEDSGYTASVVLEGLDYRNSYTVTVTGEDAVGQVSAAAAVGKGIPVFDWGEGDFAFHVPVELEQGFTCGGKALWELMYPVGAVFACGPETDPGTLFGGVWTAVENALGLQLWQRIM